MVGNCCVEMNMKGNPFGFARYKRMDMLRWFGVLFAIKTASPPVSTAQAVPLDSILRKSGKGRMSGNNNYISNTTVNDSIESSFDTFKAKYHLSYIFTSWLTIKDLVETF